MSNNPKEALKAGERVLAEAGVESPGVEAEYLLSFVLKARRHELYMDPERVLSDGERTLYLSFLERRRRGEPSQYVTGMTDFMGIPIKVTRDTLIPRPETEVLVDEFLRIAGKGRDEGAVGTPGAPSVIVDLCTGSGCMAVAAAVFRKGVRVYATDRSAGALSTARMNGEENGVSEQITFLKGDLFAPLEGLGLEEGVAFILSNPPYVPSGDIKGLQQEVRDFEPAEALDGGPDGMDIIRRIIRAAPTYLAPVARLLMEIGYGQAREVSTLAAESGAYDEIYLKKDLEGIERVLVARKKP